LTCTRPSRRAAGSGERVRGARAAVVRRAQPGGAPQQRAGASLAARGGRCCRLCGKLPLNPQGSLCGDPGAALGVMLHTGNGYRERTRADDGLELSSAAPRCASVGGAAQAARSASRRLTRARARRCSSTARRCARRCGAARSASGRASRRAAWTPCWAWARSATARWAPRPCRRTHS